MRSVGTRRAAPVRICYFANSRGLHAGPHPLNASHEQVRHRPGRARRPRSQGARSAHAATPARKHLVAARFERRVALAARVRLAHHNRADFGRCSMAAFADTALYQTIHRQPGEKQHEPQDGQAVRRPFPDDPDAKRDKSQDPPAETTGGAPEKAKAGGWLEAGATKETGVSLVRARQNEEMSGLNESLYWITRSSCRYYSLIRSINATCPDRNSKIPNEQHHLRRGRHGRYGRPGAEDSFRRRFCGGRGGNFCAD